MNILFFCITIGIAGAICRRRIGADDELDLVDVEQLGVDAGTVAGLLWSS